MTYGVERMTLGGNTLYDKLRMQFGERAAKSVDLGLKANAEKARRAVPAQDGSTSRSASVRKNARAASRPRTTAADAGAVRQASPARQNARAHAHDRVLSEPRASRIATEREIIALRNPYRARVNYMRRPVTGRSDLEISIATFPQAYNAGMRAKRAIGRGIVRDRSAANARIHYGYRPGDRRSAFTPLEASRGVMAGAYSRGERMRRVTQIESARPTPKDAKGIETPKGIEKFIRRARAVFVGKTRRAEIRIKHSPFPLGTLALIVVCVIVMMVMIGSFAEMSEYRRNISELENTHSSLEVERARLTGLVEEREDIRVIEQIATEELGMVRSDLAQQRFVSLADNDSVEIVKVDTEEKQGVFASMLSAISENLGAISDYIN